MTPILYRLDIGSLDLEPTDNPYTLVTHYDPQTVTELLLSATPTDGASGEFEFCIDTVPNDDPGSMGLFVANNSTFAFSRMPLDDGQHYNFAVWYYEETKEGEMYGEPIFWVDAYPDGGQ